MKRFYSLIVIQATIALLVLAVLPSCSKEQAQPCVTAYDIKMIYDNNKVYQYSDTTWQGNSCDVKDWSEHWVHMCIDGIPSYWERLVVKVKS